MLAMPLDYRRAITINTNRTGPLLTVTRKRTGKAGC